MKVITQLTLAVMLLTGSKLSAQIYITSTARVEFFSKTPLQDISGVNTTVSSLINTRTDSIFVRMRNTGFEFKNALMKDHFNENYMESTKYPFDTFSGKINEKIDFTKNGTYMVTVTGSMSIHGITKPTTISGTLTIKDAIVHLESEFTTHPADFNIDIPKVVFEKIAENIKVTMTADYSVLKK